MSLLTGYAFATAIVGSAVFVDRVLYGGPDDQRIALGALAGATAVGALASGLARAALVAARRDRGGPRRLDRRARSGWATWNAEVTYPSVAAAGGLFGLGFGLTVTPRSTAAVEAVGRARFGAASATVTVARMIGMAVGLAVLTAYGSTTIDRLSGAGLRLAGRLPRRSCRRRSPTGRCAIPLVVDALEAWAAAAGGRDDGRPLPGGRRGDRRGAPGGRSRSGARPRMLRDETAGGGARRQREVPMAMEPDPPDGEPEPTLAL